MINNPANTPFIVALSERGSLEAMRTYCGFSNIDNIKKTKSFKDIISFCTQHRGAVNFKGGFSAKTVELRIFKGIVSFASIMKNLEFLESMFEFSRSLRSYRKLNLQSYFEYVFKTPTNKYFALKRFLEEINYQDYIVTAQIKELVSNETDPEKIVKLLVLRWVIWRELCGVIGTVLRRVCKRSENVFRNGIYVSVSVGFG